MRSARRRIRSLTFADGRELVSAQCLGEPAVSRERPVSFGEPAVSECLRQTGEAVSAQCLGEPASW
jgi:hypothetical protein